MAQVAWSFQALSDLDDIREYVARDRPMAADRLVARLHGLAQSLNRHPERGRPIGSGRRVLAKIRPYLIRYRVADDRVIILEVRHAAREPE